MIAARDRQRWLTSWSASVLFHAGLLIFVAAWLTQPARFHVEAGKTSTEINLVIEPAPVPEATPPPPVPLPLPPAQPAPVAEPVKPVVATTLEHIFTPPSPSAAVAAKRQPPKPLTSSRATTVKETSSASQGAIEAQPDELHNEPPEYPEESRVAREQGVVILRVEVTASGEPASVGILRSSGCFRLDQAARRAIQHWKFHPALTAGIPAPSETDIPVRFKLQ